MFSLMMSADSIKYVETVSRDTLVSSGAKVTSYQHGCSGQHASAAGTQAASGALVSLIVVIVVRR